MLDHNFEPIKNGLFDPQTTGGSNGNKWAKITLAHPIVNPLYETPVKTLLDLKDSEFKSILKEEGGHEKIKNLLANINVHEQIDALISDIKTAPKTKKDKLLKKLKILKSLDSLNLNPNDAYITSVVPVVPPIFRPIFEIPGGHVQTHSLNNLYRDLGTINNAIKDLGATPELSEALYNSLGAIQGVNNPITKANEIKGVKGAIQILTGSGSPKYGFFQNKVLRKQQDLSGRATAVLNNNLNMDQIAIPEKIAKVIYKPFAIKELIKNGYTHKEATEHIDEFSDIGKKAIQAAMSDRPVLMNRAPSLHKFSIMAFQPTLTKGLSIETPGLITKPYSLDYDGDTLVLHVPATEKARKEAFDMLPSKNLYNPRTRSLNYMPDQEAILGLHLLSSSKEGLSKINALLPNDIPSLAANATKKTIETLLSNLAEKHPDKYNLITTRLKELGDNYATSKGFSLSLNDLKNNLTQVQREYRPAITMLKSKSLKDNYKLDALLKADKVIKANSLDDKTNNFVIMASSGARGSSEQVKQMLFAPGVMSDHNGDPLMRPVLNNYSQGMPFDDYWTTLYSARKAALDKQLMTAKPGALNKEVVNTTMNILITENDCGTKHGIPMNTSDNNLIGRYMTNGTLISKSNIDSIRKHHTTVDVRSPATCESSHGICQKCYGLDEYGKLPDIGHNVGIKSAQAATEPLTQAAMKTFHMGGTVSGGGGVFGGFEHVNNFLVAPETFKNKATLSTLSGKVTKITPGSAGGFHVEIDGIPHFVNPKAGDLKVKKGDSVKKGDLLNYGIPHPKDAMHLLGEIGGIHKITETLHDIYTNSGIAIDRRNLETIVRGMTGFGIVKDEGTHKHFVEGDTVPLSQIYEFNQHADKVHTMPLHDAYGMILDKNIGSFQAGSRVDKNMIQSLSRHYKEVDVKQSPIKYERTVLGVQQAPLKTRDWMSQLGFRYLKRGLQEGATYGYHSDIHGTAPIPSFVTGQLGDPSESGNY
jgi:DNA-directed RNA polymerase subunit beta'